MVEQEIRSIGNWRAGQPNVTTLIRNEFAEMRQLILENRPTVKQGPEKVDEGDRPIQRADAKYMIGAFIAGASILAYVLKLIGKL